MIRIIHLSDLHFNKKSVKEWNNYVKEALTNKLERICKKVPINLIAFTGDLIDQGGKDYLNIQEAFSIAKTEFIDHLSNELGLNRNEFLIIPGNHDINRKLDSKHDELGSKALFSEGVGNISEFITEALDKNDFDYMERIKPYKEFEKTLYDNLQDCEITIFGNAFKVKADGKTLGIACINSAWRCYDDNDKGRVLVGENQLAHLNKFISKCDYNVALIHHPLDWLSDVEKDTISNHISKDFNMLLTGHVHESKTSMTSGLAGSLFVDIAPSLLNDIHSDSRKFSNGFTIIDVDIPGSEIISQHWRYNHNQKDFVLNTDLGENGTFRHHVPKPKTSKNENLETRLLVNIKEDHFDKMDQHLIGNRIIKIPITIREAFILPPISLSLTSEEGGENEDLNILEIIKAKSNFIFFGDNESGKTTILYRLVREFVDEFSIIKKIPVYLDFEDFSNEEIITLIKGYLRASSEEVKTLLKEGSIVLLLDNLNFKKFHNDEQRKKLDGFSKTFESIQIIATSLTQTVGIPPTDYIELCNIPFRNYYIKNLRVQEIKSLMKLWVSDETELNSSLRLEKLVDNFRSYALPSSVMSVSLFLWSMEYSDKKPINKAVLLEIYIEIILEKLGKHNIYRESFDFTNKMQLLAKIAEVMLTAESTNYSISFSAYEKIIEDYLKEVGFQFDASIIATYFLERKVFIRYSQNMIKFSYSCFFHFFIAKRMIFNLRFKEEILKEETFFKFSKEIDYYSGLVRSDEALLLEIFKRTEEAFSGSEFILSEVNIDEYFTEKKSTKQNKAEHFPLVKDIDLSAIPKNRPSSNMMEKYHNEKLKNNHTQVVDLKSERANSLDSMLIMMSNILRNSEGVENRELKDKVYRAQIKYNQVWMILYREYLINYLIEHKSIPPSFTPKDFMFLMKNLPLAMQQGMNKHMGTPKLAPIILDKLKEDLRSNSISDIETFFSVALYADIEGSDFPKYLKMLVKKIGKNSVRDFTLLKLLDYYFRRTREGSSNEEMYLDLISDLKVKTENLPKRIKYKMIQAFRDDKAQFYNTNNKK